MKPGRVLWVVMLVLLATGAAKVFCMCPHINPLTRYPEPGIVQGPGVMSKTLFYELQGQQKAGDVRSISLGRFSPGAEDEIAVVGKAGAAFLTLAGEERKRVAFDRKGGRTVPVKVRPGGGWGFMNRGGGWQPVSLLDPEGRTEWKYPLQRPPAADTMAAGDLDGDGELEFVVGMNAGGGLRVLEASGELVRCHKASNVFSVEVLDVDDDGTPEILHSGKGIVIRRANGDEIATIGNARGSFSLLQPSKLYRMPILVCVRRNQLNLIDVEGVTVKAFKLPEGGHSYAEGAVAYLKGQGEAPYYAFVRTIGSSGRRAALFVFDDSGELVYHEIMPVPYLAIATLRRPGQDRETLLIGEGASVWEYGMK